MLARLALAATLLPGVLATAEDPLAVAAGEVGGPGLAIRCSKAITSALEGPAVINHALVLVRDGQIEAVRPDREGAVPSDYHLRDVGDAWVIPGLVDLHSHIGGSFDINGAVYQANPGLRVSTAIIPENASLMRALAGGVTSALVIPGSATTVGGQGILIKTGLDNYAGMVIRDPGALKVAQADNPKRWGWRMGRLFLNWHIRDTLRRGLAYARRLRAYEEGRGPALAINPQFDVFVDLEAKHTQVATHTQVHQVVHATLSIIREEMGLDVYIDHGSFDGYLAAERAEALGVPAILGPRSICTQNKGRGIDCDGRFVGMASEYQKRGHSAIGFNTDAPVMPGEELSLQAAMGVHYGFDDSEMGTVRGLTIVPAMAAGIDRRVGSLEKGKDADLVVITGHPADPRSAVELVWIEGQLVYDAEVAERRAF